MTWLEVWRICKQGTFYAPPILLLRALYERTLLTTRLPYLQTMFIMSLFLMEVYHSIAQTHKRQGLTWRGWCRSFSTLSMVIKMSVKLYHAHIIPYFTIYSLFFRWVHTYGRRWLTAHKRVIRFNSFLRLMLRPPFHLPTRPQFRNGGVHCLWYASSLLRLTSFLPYGCKCLYSGES